MVNIVDLYRHYRSEHLEILIQILISVTWCMYNVYSCIIKVHNLIHNNILLFMYKMLARMFTILIFYYELDNTGTYLKIHN